MKQGMIKFSRKFCLLFCVCVSTWVYSQSLKEKFSRFDQLSDLDKLTFIMDEAAVWRLENSPSLRLFYDSSKGVSEWEDLSFDNISRLLSEQEYFLDKFRMINMDKLPEDQRWQAETFGYLMEIGVKLSKYPFDALSIHHMSGYHVWALEFINMMPREDFVDYQNILSLLKKIPVLFDQLTDWAREGMKINVTESESSVVLSIKFIEELLAKEGRKSPFFEPFKTQPEGINDEEWYLIVDNAKTIIQESVYPAYEKLLVFISESYLPNSRQSPGWNSLPDGDSWYNLLIETNTTLPLTADEIHELGKIEVVRLKSEMEKVKTETGFEGTLEDFIQFLQTDEQFYFNNPEELVTAYQALCKRIDPELVRLFKRFPQLPYGVKAAPEYSKGTKPFAYYFKGNWQNGLPGTFYINTNNVKGNPKWGMEALALHEAVPGHHFQISIAQELDIPLIQQMSFWTAYVEGWGLYSESLGKELGFYTDPYSYFGRLNLEMLRAIRLVVDTGIHSKGWTRDEAIQYFQAHSAIGDPEIEAEVDRYIVWPAQALTYKIGELKILELREKAEKALGNKFDVRAFHDEILNTGSLPLEILERKIDRWIESF